MAAHVRGEEYPDSFVEYILSDGTQYIDIQTEQSPTACYYVDMKRAAGNAGNYNYFGSMATSAASPAYAYITWDWLYTRGKRIVKQIAQDVRSAIVIDAANQTISINGAAQSLVNYTSAANTGATGGGTYLFWAKNSTEKKSKMYLYACAVTNDGVAVRDLVPCIKDNRCGLFDKVSKTIFYQAEGNDFASGGWTNRCDTSDRLTVTASPLELGVVTPAYGAFTGWANGQTAEFSAPAVIDTPTLKAVCTGCRVYDVNQQTLAATEIAGSPFGTTFTYTHGSSMRKAVWQFANVSNKVDVTSDGGTVAVENGGWYALGSMVTLTAVPDAGKAFYRWTGDVPAGQEANQTLTFVSERPVALTATYGGGLFVATDGDDATADGTSAHPFATISAAIAAANDGDEIAVDAGTYSVSADIVVDKAVTIQSLTGNAEDVIVRRGSGNIHIFSLNNANAVVRDLTIQDGYLSANYVAGCCVLIGAAGGRVENCVIRNSTCNGWDAKGCVNLGSADAVVSHCVISNCTSSSNQGGSAIYISAGLVENTLITGNSHTTSSYKKGIVTMIGGALVNCTVAGNTGYVSSGVCVDKDAAQVINCLIADNELTSSSVAADAVYVGKASSFVSCLAPVQINASCLTGLIGFKDPSAGDFALTAGSFAIDAGGAQSLVTALHDLAGNPRVSGEAIDIGAYEFDSSRPHVAISAPVASGLTPLAVDFQAHVFGATAVEYRWDLDGDGVVDETTALPSLPVYSYTGSGRFPVSVTAYDGNGAEIGASENVLAILTYPGTMYVDAASATPIAPFDSPATAAATLQAALDAAFEGAEIIVMAGRYQVDSAVSLAKGVRVRSESGKPEDVVFHHKPGTTSYRIFTINNAAAELQSVTVEGGYLQANNSYGGGIYVDLLGGTVSNCVIRNCHVGGWDSLGGGLYIVKNGADALVTHCVITNNDCSTGGSTGVATGGSAAFVGSGVLRNSLLAYNYQPATDTANAPFGAVQVDGGLVESCTIVKNSARQCGGVNARGGVVRNCVIAGNVSTSSSDPQNAVWTGNASFFENCLGSVAINESCLVEADPFASASSGRFELAAGSVGIDAATFQDWMADAGDLAGAARVSGNGPDIGAYEADASAFGASFAADPSEGFGPLAVTLTVTPANAGAAGIVCEWFFDNEATPSETSSDLTLEKVFAIGTHTVRLRVTDIASAMQYEVPGYLTIMSAPRVMYVAPNGSANTPEVPFATPETAAANVKDAVDTALPGAEIVLLRGLHNPPSDSVVYINKPVVIRGETARPEETEIATLSHARRIFSINNAASVIRDLTITGTKNGAGNSTSAQCVYFDAGGGMVSNCVIRNAEASVWGTSGAAVIMDGPGILSHCVISNNVLGCSAGKEKGIAVAIKKAGARMENCLLTGNRTNAPNGTQAEGNGGVVYLTAGTMANCTVVGNSYQGCAGVYADGGRVVNTLIADNVSTVAGGEAAVWRGNSGYFDHCVARETGVDGHIEQYNVHFKNAAGGDFTFMSSNKALVNKGDNAASTEATDLLGHTRKFGGHVDIGCYECLASDSTLLLIR